MDPDASSVAATTAAADLKSQIQSDFLMALVDQEKEVLKYYGEEVLRDVMDSFSEERLRGCQQVMKRAYPGISDGAVCLRKVAAVAFLSNDIPVDDFCSMPKYRVALQEFRESSWQYFGDEQFKIRERALAEKDRIRDVSGSVSKRRKVSEKYPSINTGENGCFLDTLLAQIKKDSGYKQMVKDSIPTGDENIKLRTNLVRVIDKFDRGSSIAPSDAGALRQSLVDIGAASSVTSQEDPNDVYTCMNGRLFNILREGADLVGVAPSAQCRVLQGDNRITERLVLDSLTEKSGLVRIGVDARTFRLQVDSRNEAGVYDVSTGFDTRAEIRLGSDYSVSGRSLVLRPISVGMWRGSASPVVKGGFSSGHHFECLPGEAISERERVTSVLYEVVRR